MEQIDPGAPLPQGADYVPVALVWKNLKTFARAKGIKLVDDQDDFDAYSMARLRLEDEEGCDFLLLHYAGADANTFDIWLPTSTSNPTKCLLDIIKELQLESRELVLRQLSENVFKMRRPA